jgi:ParB family chromosome partitioning protein
MPNMIYIPIDKLHEHPHNPRKNIGDVSELAESIKVKGVLQNLTVVPGSEPDNYTILIGHRRYNAAKLAGLTELPCTITEMSEEDQIATMLVENMQRSDLTLYEEAKGFQMMLDLGKSVKEVSEISGFSETTVRKRVKLAELDEEKFKQAVDRGATLFDFAKLDEIEDVSVKNYLLDKLGSPDFKNEITKAITEQKNKKQKALWVEQLSKWATQVEIAGWSCGEGYAIVDDKKICLKWVRSFSNFSYKQDTIETPSDIDSVKYYFVVCSNCEVDLYSEQDMSAEEAKAAEKAERDAKSEAKRQQFDEISKRHRQLRLDFVSSFGQFNHKSKEVWEFVTEAMIDAKASSHSYYYFAVNR